MPKSVLLRESFVATLLVLMATYLISFIPLSREYAKVLSQGFADFDVYDLYYSGKDKQHNIVDNDILLVELGTNRPEIAEQVRSISRYSPKIIAIDATFERPGDSTEDLLFSREMNLHSNIVFANSFDKGKYFVPNIFSPEAANTSSGYIDFSSIADYSVIRTYVPFYGDKSGNQYEAFTSAIARHADIQKYRELKKRDNDMELINYAGNLNNFLSLENRELKTLDSRQLETLIKNKIVLIGFFTKHPPLVMDDLHYSPLNEEVSGKSFPDMYGVVVHANILSMILNNRYATMVSKKAGYIFAFIITFLLNLYFISRFHKKTHPSHASLILIQLLVILLVVYSFLMIYNWFLFKVPLEPIMISMVLSLELLGLYKSFALWLHRKYHYHTIFTHKHII